MKVQFFFSFGVDKNKAASGIYRRIELYLNLESNLVVAEERKK